MTGDDDIDWRDGSPRSRRFGDIYFDPRNGAAESRFVFLDGCDLPSAWSGRDQFVIGETGFGTGLNFLQTWDLWRRQGPAGARLHFVSVEGFPLSPDALARAARSWPELQPLVRRLLQAYPAAEPGYHRLSFTEDRVWLTLMFGEVQTVLDQLEGCVDAWYLDGFAPARNPAMWQPAVFERMARSSRPGTRVATFTAAGAVRRGLQAAGFEMHKAPGFGHKRERLVGRFSGPPATSPRPAWSARDGDRPMGPIALVGDGLAGHCLEAALADRGVDGVVLAASGPCASDNPLANVMPRLPAIRSGPGRLAWSAYLHACRQWADAGMLRVAGALQLPGDSAAEQRLMRVAERWGRTGAVRWLDVDEASEHAGLRLSTGGLWSPGAGLVRGPAARAGSRWPVVRQTVRGLRRDPAGWWLSTDDGGERGPFGAVLCATGPGTPNLLPDAALGLSAWAGQVSGVAPTSESRRLRCTLVAGGYLTPVDAGLHWLGATFDATEFDASPALDAARHRRNMDHCPWPGLAGGEIRSGWAGTRVTTRDRLPVAGPVTPSEILVNRFDDLRRDARREHHGPALAANGLYVLGGLGSRAYSQAQLAAELVAARLLGEPWPMERELGLLLDPARFVIRDLKRGREPGPDPGPGEH